MTRDDFLKKWALASPVYEGLPADHPGSPLADLTALLEAERAKAREEQRDVDACSCPSCHGVGWVERQIDCPFCSDSTHGHVCPEGTERHHCACGSVRIRATPLTATPLADRIAELERERIEARTEAASMRLVLASVLPWVRRDAFDAQCAWESARALLDRYNNEKKVRAEKAEAALDRARVERDDAERPRDEWRARAEKAERERDEALKLAYVGDHRFSDLTYKARLEELVPKLREVERERDEAREESKESAASDMDSLQRLRAVEPALERARVERDDAERARDEWKARAEKAEAERDEARAEAARLADLHRRCEAYDDQSGPSCVVLRARAEKAERERDEWKARAEKAEEQFGVLLEGLESCGWPCRLVELPVERQLAECRDRARDTKKEAALRETAEAQPAIAKAEGDEWRARSERAETELREVLSVLEGGGPATETLFALAQRGTAKKIRALLGLTLAPEVGS